MTPKLETRGGARKNAGRKALPPGEKLVPITIMVSPSEREQYFERGGSPWARIRLFCDSPPLFSHRPP